jgi:outer membrane biosynthesis protein TonB
MAHYMTRHLEASIDLLHGDRLVAKGERFEAVDVDADYYIQRRKAVEVKEEPPKKAATPAQTPPAKPKPEQAKPAAPRAAVAPKAAPAPAESMLTTTRDQPGPGQDQAKPSDDAKAEPQA